MKKGDSQDESSTQQGQSFIKRGKNQLVLRAEVVKKPAELNSKRTEESPIKAQPNEAETIKVEVLPESGNDSESQN